MPIYEYEYIDDQNNGTGEIIEIFHKMSDPTLSVCPTTGRRIAKIFSVPKVHGEPTTVAGLAEKNTARLKKAGSDKIKKPKKPEIPWWRKSEKINKNLLNLNKKQKEHYIQTGEIK